MKRIAYKSLFFIISSLLLYSCNRTELVTPAPTPVTIQTSDTTQITQLVFTADLHYGLTRAFRGNVVSSTIVNEAMVKQINTLPTTVFPNDGGVNAGREIDFIDYVAIGGDITNRQQGGIQSATASWAQFSADFLNGVALKNKKNQSAEFLLTPGNHDVSNTIGYYKALSPAIDNTAVVNIYNMMLKPAVPKTSSTYDYNTDKPNYSKDVTGVHLVFVTMWPDSANRVWMEKDLSKISTTTPVVIFTHDPAAGEAAHFTNPLGNYSLTADYENEIEEHFKGSLDLEREFATFLKAHSNIKAYFHGHTNYNEYYTFMGPDGDLNLPVFRVDSPMKGAVSVSDESKLSFQVLSIDSKSKKLTVRECFYNAVGFASTLTWGVSSTVAL
jgi:hypothetical protein